MKAFFQSISNAVTQATLPDRLKRTLEMPDSPARRETLRKILLELKPHLGIAAESAQESSQLWASRNAIVAQGTHIHQATKQAQDIASALLSGNPKIEDLEEVERISSVLRADCRRELDRKLAKAAAKSVDEKAFTILVKLGEHHPKDSQIQTHLGRALLKKEKLEFALLQKLACSVPFLPNEDRVAAGSLLAPWFDVCVDAEEARIREAEAVASQFSHSAEYLSGVARVLGIGALRLHGQPETAAEHFAKALIVDPADAQAKEGQRRALLESGRFDALEKLEPEDEENWGVLKDVLQWLEGEGPEAEPPLSAVALARQVLPNSAGWHRDFALARLHLIEGDSDGAAKLLEHVAARDPDLGRVSYYACWAELLSSGSRSKLEDRLIEYQDWAGAWTLLSRVWDADPSAADGLRDCVLGEADPDFAALMRARRALALDEDSQTVPSRTSPCLEEEIEAFRIRLGRACMRRDIAGVSSRLTHPFFRLLPKADRLFWTAMLHCIQGDAEAAPVDFEKAASLGHRRAAWAISVLCAQRGRIGEAVDWSSKALAERHDERAGFWRRWLAAANGDIAAQADIVADGQAGKRSALASAYFGVARADAAQRSGDFEEATRIMSQSLAAFRGVHVNNRSADDATLMAACLQFWLTPQRGAPALSSFWSQVEAMPSSPRRAWLMWLVILAKLARNDPRQPEETAAALQKLLREAGPLSDSVRGALVRSLAGIIQDASDPASSERWQAVLRQFSCDALAGEQRLATAAAAWRRCTVVSGSDPALARELELESTNDRGNSVLALIAAYAQLQSGEGRAAAEILLKASEAGGPPWMAAVAEGFPGQVPGEAMARLGSLDLDMSAATGLLLRALGVFREGQRDPGFDLVLRAWRLRPEKVPDVFRVSQWVAVVCAGAAGQAPPQLLATVKELGAAERDPKELDRLAHCAAVLSSAGLARHLWSRAVEQSVETRSFDRADFSRNLSHLASIEARASRPAEALALVREAAGHLPAAAQPASTAGGMS